MALRKSLKADVKRRYPLYVQVGLLSSLGLLTLAFTVPLQPDAPFEIVAPPLEPVPIEEIQPTRHFEQPPPPPAPPPPQEVPDETVIEEQVIDMNQDVDLRDAPRIPPPPPLPHVETPPVVEPPPPPEIFEVVEQMPELQGGIQGLQARIQYPEMARRAGIEGRVFVQFVVNEQGFPSDVQVLRGIGGGCDEAAIQAVQESRFTPGLQRGRPVKVRMSLPVTFRLSN